MDFGVTLWGVGDVSAVLSVIWRSIIVLLGVNALIIVHEWGHFIVARLCGVRCDKFYIWFDAYNFRFFRFKWGDTEYGLGWLPLGGYVKMLGQEDNPAGIKDEIERAKKDLSALEAGESTGEKNGDAPTTIDEAQKILAEKEKLQKDLYAPDSYLSKNVFQRMAIISAGVIMNVIFAIICATAAVMIGFPELTSRIGSILPGCPAWESGLLPGDKIAEMNGKPSELFADIRVAMLDRKPVSMKIQRGSGEVSETLEKTIAPTMSKGQMTPTIGVLPAYSLNLNRLSSPMETTLDNELNQQNAALFAAIPEGARLTALDGQPIDNEADYLRYLSGHLADSIQYEFTPTDKKGNLIEGEPAQTVTIPAKPASRIGIQLTFGEITSLINDSPAANAGLQKQVKNEKGEIVTHGDIPVAINGEPLADPLAFPYEFHQKTLDESINEVTLTVSRNGENIDITLPVSREYGYSGEIGFGGQLACQELGFTFKVLPVISKISSSVQVTSENQPIGAVVKSIDAALEEPGADTSSREKALYESLIKLGSSENGQFHYAALSESDDENADKILNWFTSFLPYLSEGTPIKITAQGEQGEIIQLETSVAHSDSVFLLDRGISFAEDTQWNKTKNLAQAFQIGCGKTFESMGMIFQTLKNIGRNVSAKAFGGPVMIVDVAYKATGTGDGTFLLFLCLIGANLAVVNILPIPVLDGGHLLFLLYELIFRKPPNENVQIILSYIGLFLLLGLMVWVLLLDFARIGGWL